MVEQDRFPVAFHMAGFTFLPVFPLMLVDLDMTGNAFQRGSLVFSRRDMAFAALHVQMLALEREMGLFNRVIELCLFPGTLVMAGFAVGAQTAPVLVILVMAVVAGGRRFAILFVLLVAIRALYLFLVLVRAQQQEIGLAVIEFLRIKYDYLRISAFVFSVAGAAYFFIKPAVVSLVILYIRFHVLVAICTQAALRFLVETNVAMRAFRLEFGVTLDHFARHQRNLACTKNEAGK